MAIQGVRHGLRTRGSFNVGIKLSGDWIKFNQLVQSMDVKTLSAASLAQQGFAEKYRDRVKTNIRTGGRRFGYKNHSTSYKAYKRRHGGSNRLFYWGGSLHDSVSIVSLPGGRVGVGIPKDARRQPYHRKEGNLLSVSEYANILEHGAYSRGVVKRPIFSDTFTKDMGGLRKLKSFLTWHIARDLNRKGIKTTRL